MVSMGFVPGEASPCCFYREADDAACVVHGDDFTFEGPPYGLKAIAEEMRQFWIIKVRAVLGPEASDDKKVSILNRVLRWTEDCLLYEADPRHVEKLLREADMGSCNGVIHAWSEGGLVILGASLVRAASGEE